MTDTSQATPEDHGGSSSQDDRPDPATEAFLAHRNLLFTAAYELLGSAADAEDVLQETWLRWVDVDLDSVRDQRAYLVRITTRQALGRLRTLGRRKESYVGPWLPEPLLTTPDVAEDVELADSVSMAMLLVLETLTPTERAVFLLREVFELGYDEIPKPSTRARLPSVRSPTGRGHTSLRAGRAGSYLRPRPEMRSGRSNERSKRAICRASVDILAPDVVLLSDGGGVKQALLRPIVGADRVARLLAVGIPRIVGEMSVEPVHTNGCPALIVRLDGEIDNVVAVRIDDGLITGLYIVRRSREAHRNNRSAKPLCAAESGAAPSRFLVYSTWIRRAKPKRAISR